MSDAIRVAIADDHPVVRRGLRAFLDSLNDIEVVGEAVDGEEAVRLTVTEEPDVLLLDEPFGSLDLLTRTALGEELSRIVTTTRVPTIVITHSIEEAVFLASRVIILSRLPTSILEEVPIPLGFPRTVDVLSDRKFLDIVVKCRSTLLRGVGSQ